MSTFFTSDLHFDHKNIIRYCSRPVTCVEEMNEVLITNFNLVVKPTDVVYMLGDISFGKLDRTINHLLQLNGRKFLVPGNHDQVIMENMSSFEQVFEDILPPLTEISLLNRRFVLCHYPIEEWNGKWRGAIHVHGHQHGPAIPKNGRLDIGVDGHGLAPWHAQDVINLLEGNSK